MTIDDLILKLKTYNKEEESIVRKAYEYAKYLHDGQYRQSGEPYIIHPLNVAYILADMHADKDTICAGLLHDTLEDTNITKEDIANLFNQNVANLVDGVTKLAKMNFSSKQELNYANTRKIITGITEDVRIIIIKLADRLHNMRTLQFKSEFKQKENAIETLEIFVPLAYYIGAYRIKSELEDLSLYYLKNDLYKKIEEKRLRLEKDSSLIDMSAQIKDILDRESLNNEIKVRVKNVYGIYKRLNEGIKISEIHDLLSLKVMVDEVMMCYYVLGLIHKKYYPINEKFKDYICNPKTNMYRSLHTTVFGPNDNLIQTQIRTFDMDKIASFGLTAYWDIEKGNARYVMQDELKNKYQFFRSLTQINAMFADNQDFVNQIKAELFADKVYVYASNGEIKELPNGSTVIDFAYALDSDIANNMVGAYVNDLFVPVTYRLKNKDRVRIITDILLGGPKDDWLDNAHTVLAKQKIKEYKKN